MEKDPESILVQEEPDVNNNVTIKKCSFALKVGCMCLVMIVCALSTCVVYLTGWTFSGTLSPLVEFMINLARGICLSMGFYSVVIFCAQRFIASRERYATEPYVNENLKIIWFCKISSSFLYLIGWGSFLFVYQDIQIRWFFIWSQMALGLLFVKTIAAESDYRPTILTLEEARKEEEVKAKTFRDLLGDGFESD